MATKKRPIKIVTRYEDQEDDDITPAQMDYGDPAEESFSQFRQKFGTEGVIVKIYRRTPRGVQYCFHGVPSEIDEEVVRLYHSKQSYAGEEGQYSARCFVNGEGRDSFPILIAPQVAAPGLDGGMGFAGGQSDVIKLLMAQNERLEQRLNQTAFQEREPLSSLADAMVKLQSLQPKSDLPLDTLIKAVELGRTLSGDGGNSTSEWGPILKDVLSQAGPVIGQLLGGLVAKTQPQPAAIAEGQPMNAEATEQQMELMLRQAIGLLKRKCLGGSDPALYIEVIYDNREDATYQALIHRILDKPFSAFIDIDPEIGTGHYEAFFITIYNGVREAFSESSAVVVDPAQQKGNTADAKGNGGAGAKRKA